MAWILYLIGFAVTLTSPTDYPIRGHSRGLQMGFAFVAAVFWPALALIIVGQRIWGAFRHG